MLIAAFRVFRDPNAVRSVERQDAEPAFRQGRNFESLSCAVLGARIHVERRLGVRCTEVDYRRALALALPRRSPQSQREVETPIAYEDAVLTKRRADCLISDDRAEPLETKARRRHRAGGC